MADETWSYSGDPASSPRDHVRFLCGDTDSTAPLLTDAEINYLLSLKLDPYQAAVGAFEAILTKLAREVNYAIGPERVDAAKRYEAYKDLMRIYKRSRVNVFAAPVHNGGESHLFDIGMHDNGGRTNGLTN